MRTEFVRNIKNVRKFISAMDNLVNKEAGLEGMGLVVGEKGLGKTRTAIWYAANNPATVYVRAKSQWKSSWMLRDIAWEMGLPRFHSVEEAYNSIVDVLRQAPRLIIIDEIGRHVRKETILEALRDLHDDSGAPIVFIVQQGTDRQLARFESLFDRLNEIVVFTRYDKEDMAAIATSLCEVKFKEGGLDAFAELVEKRFRPARIALSRLERWAKINKLDAIDADHVKAMLNCGRAPAPTVVPVSARRRANAS